jgi:hypothetical protein
MDIEQRRRERLDRGIQVRSDGLYALLSLSFDLLAHFVGLVSLGGAFFIGVGGYTTAILNTKLGLPPLLSIPIATVIGATICTLFLLPCLPLRGVYFAIITLMYPLLLIRVIEALDILGGTDGIVGIDSFANRWVEQYFIILMVLLFLFGTRRLVNLDIGLVFRAVKSGGCLLGSSLHVGRAFFLRPGFFHSAHRSHRHRWGRHLSGTGIGRIYTGAHLRIVAGCRNIANRYLLIHTFIIHCYSQ